MFRNAKGKAPAGADLSEPSLTANDAQTRAARPTAMRSTAGQLSISPLASSAAANHTLHSSIAIATGVSHTSKKITVRPFRALTSTESSLLPNGKTSSPFQNNNITNNVSSSTTFTDQVCDITPPSGSDVAQDWTVLETAVGAILQQKQLGSSIEELYRLCESLCHRVQFQWIYSNLVLVMEKHLEKEADTVSEELLTKKTAAASTMDRLTVIASLWKRYCKQLLVIRCVFLYLDRSYLLRSSQHRTIWDMGLQIFREKVVEKKIIEEDVVAGILNLIHDEREGAVIDRQFLRSMIKMTYDLKLYFQLIGTPFIEATRKYYLDRRNEWAPLFSKKSGHVADYLRFVTSTMNKELKNYSPESVSIDPSTAKKLKDVLIVTLVREVCPQIISGSFDDFVQDRKSGDLKMLYTLLRSAGKLEQFKIALQSYVERTGFLIFSRQYSRDSDAILHILAFRNNCNILIKHVLENDDVLASAVKDGFEVFLNKKPNFAELLAKYLDSRLRSGKSLTLTRTNDQTTVPEDLADYKPGTMEGELQDCLVLFKDLSAKDMFQAFYKKDLAARLLQGKSSSYDQEHFMLKKLRDECGPAFTSHLEGMFKDMESSHEYMVAFKAAPGYSSLNMEVYINVLSTGFWPQWPQSECKLPEEFVKVQKSFKKFYEFRHSGRVLTWSHSHSKAVIKAEFQKGNKELTVTLFQALIILLFNVTEVIEGPTMATRRRATRASPGKEKEIEMGEPVVLSFDAIQKSTGIPEKDLLTSLQAISTEKCQILSRFKEDNEEVGPNVSKSDIFKVNEDFEHPLIHIKVNGVQMKERDNESDKTKEQVFYDRQLAVDAAIVRIMKANRNMTHSALLKETEVFLKMEIPIPDFKKRVDSLIERDYIERDGKDKNVYLYVV